jgi:hypothetical protein
VFWEALLLLSAAAADTDAIGRITFVDRKYWKLRVHGRAADRDAVRGGLIHEKDEIQTIAGQRLAVLLNDGTELFIGPSSRVAFTTWFTRDSDDRLERTITLTAGMVKAKVRKVYSQDEPFLVVSPYGVAGVRGTDFVAEAGHGGRLAYARRLSAGEHEARRTEFEVHTLEGEVHVASDRKALKTAETRVAVRAGQTSLIRDGMRVPQQPRSFDLGRYSTYLAKAAPGVELKVVKNTSNSRRAELASNSRGLSGIKAVSPAQPSYARAQRAYDIIAGRAPAAVAPGAPGAKLAGRGAGESGSRRKELLGEFRAGVKSQSQAERLREREAGRTIAHSLRDAFSGGDADVETTKRGGMSRALVDRHMVDKSQLLRPGTRGVQITKQPQTFENKKAFTPMNATQNFTPQQVIQVAPQVVR